MAETSQSATGPYVAMADAELALNAWIAAFREALVVKVAGSGSEGGGGDGGGGDGGGEGGGGAGGGGVGQGGEGWGGGGEGGGGVGEGGGGVGRGGICGPSAGTCGGGGDGGGGKGGGGEGGGEGGREPVSKKRPSSLEPSYETAKIVWPLANPRCSSPARPAGRARRSLFLESRVVNRPSMVSTSQVRPQSVDVYT